MGQYRAGDPRVLGLDRGCGDIHIPALILVEVPSPDNLLGAVVRYRATCLFAAPVAYRYQLCHLSNYDISCLRHCVSAGDSLPKATSYTWYKVTGICN